MTRVNHALALARRGWSVLPLTWPDGDLCSCGDPDCPSPAKHPLTPRGFKQASRDPKVIDTWWDRWPDANIGVRTGAESGFVVLDIDGPEGEETLHALEQEHGKLPNTPEVITGRGRHLYLSHPGGRVVSRRVAAGLDVKGDDGYVVAPGSVHAKGKEYVFEVSSHPDDVDLAPMPSWLRDMTGDQKEANSSPDGGWVAEVLDGLTEGHRNEDLTRIAGALRRAGLEPDDITALLVPHAEACGLSAKELRTIAKSVGRYDAEKVSVHIGDAVPTETKMPFRTAAEIARETPPQTEYVVDGYVASGAITELGGKVKTAGKTTLLTHMSRAVLDGKPFLGKPTTKTGVVYLTEQPPVSFREALGRADLMDRLDFVVLSWRDTVGVPWPEVARAAVAEAKTRGAGLLVVDTLPQFAGLKGDAENSSGQAFEALAPLQEAAAEGLAVVVVRHERKSGGDIVDAGRGSSAFSGAVDIVVSVRRGEGNTRPTVRVLEAVSRFTETPDKLVIELTDNGYVTLGSETEVALREARQAILDSAPTTEDEAVVEGDLLDAVSRSTGKRAIEQLIADGALGRTGQGKKGSPFKYWGKFVSKPPVVRTETNQEVSVHTPTPNRTQRNGQSDYFHHCRECGADVDYYADDGEPWCERHAPTVAPVPARQNEPGGVR
ncbi:MAG: bifunctional DNA primase/polymerase [Chloroflexi bacterium]|nr:bifunctional DNA primase/polymerase [Chloroflexota bacterium]